MHIGYAFLGSNVGDQAIIAGTLAYLRNAGVDDDISVLSNTTNARSRAIFAGIGGRQFNAALKQWDTKVSLFNSRVPPVPDLLDEVLNSKVFIQSIFDAAGFSGDQSYIAPGEVLFSREDGSADWQLFGYLLPFLAAAKMGVKVDILPATYGPFETSFSQKLIKLALSMFRKSYSRDGYADLIPNGFSETISDGLDMAYHLPYFEGDRIGSTTAISKSIVIVPRLETFGLRYGPVMSNAFMKNSKTNKFSESTSLNFYVSLITKLMKDPQVNITILTQSNNDWGLNQAIIRTLLATDADNSKLRVLEISSLRIYLDRISRADVVITSRIHSAIFASAQGIPVIAAVTNGHGHKSPNMMAQIGLGDFTAFIADHDSVGKVLEMYNTIQADRENLADRIYSNVREKKAQFSTLQMS